jgi:CheY-like chemotaxis protein
VSTNQAFNILLVEDNNYDVSLLVESFAQVEKPPHIKHVQDGHQALDYVYRRSPQYQTASKPDLILLDLGLPRISGYDVLKQLKTDKRYSDIPVAVLTTSCNPLDKNQCLALGADVYLTKPNSLSGYKILAREVADMAANTANK